MAKMEFEYLPIGEKRFFADTGLVRHVKIVNVTYWMTTDGDDGFRHQIEPIDDLGQHMFWREAYLKDLYMTCEEAQEAFDRRWRSWVASIPKP